MNFTRHEIDKLNKLLKLPSRPDEQDWELIQADPEKIDSFIEFYTISNKLNSNDKGALITLISASFEGLDRQRADLIWPKLKNILIGNWKSYYQIVIRWACLAEPDQNNAYHNAKYFRSLILDFLNGKT